MITRRHRCLSVGFVPLLCLVVSTGNTAAYIVPFVPRGRSKLQPGATAVSDARSSVLVQASKRREGALSDEENDTKKDERRTRSKAGEILSAVTSVLPFGASDNKASAPKKKEVEGGVFGQWFRRKNEDAVNGETPKSEKRRHNSSNAPSKRQFPSVFAMGENADNDKKKLSKTTTEKQSKQSTSQSGSKNLDGSESNENSALRQIQGLFPFNSPPEKPKNAKGPEEGSSNPLASLQKLFTLRNSDPFTKNAGKEDWYPVFPKTRIMPGEIKPVTVKGLDLLVVASTDNRSLYCIANSCPHLGTPLETGRLTRLPTEAKATSPDVTTAKDFFFSETDVSNMLSQDGCEDCIVCPLHHTAFALQSGEVRGEWCPYPPVLGALLGTVKPKTSAAVFDVRTRGKNVEVRLNSILLDPTDPPQTSAS